MDITATIRAVLPAPGFGRMLRRLCRRLRRQGQAALPCHPELRLLAAAGLLQPALIPIPVTRARPPMR